MKKFVQLAGTVGISLCLSGTALAATNLSFWYHGAGNEVEAKIINQIVAEFNESQSDWTVELQSFPQNSYNDSVTAGALAGNLPDILDVDGPVMPNWAWSGYLAPLEIDESILEQFLPGPKGYWDGKLYSIGLWDAAVAMITRRSTLEEFDIRIPTLEEPWTLEEFDAGLVKIKDSGKFDYPLDLGMAWTGEWYPYAFSPFLQSFGGDLVDRSTYQTADGVLNGEAAIEFGEWWQSLFERDLAPGTSQDPADRDSGFLDGKYAITWNGNWAALKAVETFGDDLLFLPAPDFGEGPVIGAASWQFAVSSASEHPEGGAAFIKFSLQDKYLAQFSDALGLIPPTPASAAMSKNYSEGAAMAPFYKLSEVQGLVRPVTPGYVVQAKVFEKALADIANGADPADTLDGAVDEIELDIERNSGYGH